MQKSYYTFLVSCIILQSSHSLILAQDSSQSVRSNTYWLNLGEGFSLFGISLGAGLTYQSNDRVLSARYIYSYEYQSVFTGPAPDKFQEEICLLYGLDITSTEWDFTSVAFGLSYIRGRDRGRFLYAVKGPLGRTDWYEEISISTIGISFEAQAFWRPLRFFGMGTTVFANVTRSNFLIGVLLSLQLGKLERP